LRPGFSGLTAWAGKATREEGPDGPARFRLERRYSILIARALREQLRRALGKGKPRDIDAAVQRLQEAGEPLRRVLFQMLRDAAEMGAREVIARLERPVKGWPAGGVADNISLRPDWALVNEGVEKWITGGGEFSVGNQWGEVGWLTPLYDQIMNTSGKTLRWALVDWVQTGEPLPKLTRRLEPMFGPKRAHMIAVTETTRAYQKGNEQAWLSTGEVQQPPHTAPPLHVNCRCFTDIRMAPDGWHWVWFTARDEMVCPACRPLHQKMVGLARRDKLAPKQPKVQKPLEPEPVKPKPMTEPKLIKPAGPPEIFPADVNKVELVRRLGGSTGAELVRDPATGALFVRKMGPVGQLGRENAALHLRAECVSDAAYQAMGAKVPEFKLYETPEGPVKLSRFIENGRLLAELSDEAREAAIKKLQQHFAVDALFAHHDLLGADMDNILIDQAGEVWRIDNGGGMAYRAQGQVKAGWNAYPEELWTMRNPRFSAGRAFGGMTWDEVTGQFQDIFDRADALKKVTGKTEWKVLEKRIEELRRMQGITGTFKADNWKMEYVDEFCKHTIGLRQAGIVDKMPKEIQSTGSYGEFADEKGLNRAGMRGAGSVTDLLTDYINTKGNGDWSLLKLYFSSQASSSWNDAAVALKFFLAEQRTVSMKEYAWEPAGGLKQAEINYKNCSGPNPAQYASTMTAWHAANYELLSRVKMPWNNLETGEVQLIRTENQYIIQGTYKLERNTKGVTMPRGAADSSSIWRPVSVCGSERTWQIVPHHRVIGTYFFGRGGADFDCCFAGDGENEFITMWQGIKFDYQKDRPAVPGFSE